LSAAIRAAHGDKVEVVLHPGDGGIFDVKLDGAMVFRKWDEGRFPTNAEILKQIENRQRKA